MPADDDLALADGFEYAVLSTSGRGRPAAYDGMAAFGLPDGSVRLLRNHELSGKEALDPATAYDPKAGGGTTTLVLASDLRSVDDEFVSLSGTVRNCSGGATPWRSWLSCEESTESTPHGRSKPHGYVFEIPVSADGPVEATPLTEMGRFLHEAAAVDPSDGTVYLTEDNGYDSGLYRFTPDVPGRLASGGRLEMLAVDGEDGFDTAYGRREGLVLPVRWVPIDDPDPAAADEDTSAVFNQGLARGGARFRRGEGCCFVGSTLFVTATEGGNAVLGQVWALDPAAAELRLVLEADAVDELCGPDNITPGPQPDTVVVAEDPVAESATRLHVLGPDGSLVTFAENISDGTEFAGVCFSPDGTRLFANIYGDESAEVAARTVVIWGPWDSLG